MAKVKSANGGDGPKVNKSQAIRDLLKQNPKAGSKEIVSQLAKAGIKVAPTLVYYIKSKQNQAARRTAPARGGHVGLVGAGQPGGPHRQGQGAGCVVGGIRNLRRLVDVLAE